MTFKTLLLGSAAAVMMVGGAQAADLKAKAKVVPEPVNYVKACDALGSGYWYAPGTQTCIRVGGYVQFDVGMGDPTGAGVGGIAGGLDDHYFRTEASITLTANTSTEYGPLIGFIDYRARSDGSGAQWPTAAASANPTVASYGDKDAYVSDAYLSLGPLFAGYTQSVFGDAAGTYTVVNNSFTASQRVDQIRLDWAFSGFKVQLAAEDYRDRYADARAGINAGASSNQIAVTDVNRPTGEIPDLVGAISGTFGLVSAKVSGGYGARFVNDTYGVSGVAEINLDAIAKGDRLKFYGAYAKDGGDFADVPVFLAGDYWAFAATARHYWTPTVSSAATYNYVSAPGTYVNEAVFSTTFVPVNGLAVTGEVMYENPISGSDYVAGYVRIKRSIP